MLTNSTNNNLEEITLELIEAMLALNLDPKPYGLAIQLTAETIMERNEAYKEYLENGGTHVNEKGKSDARSLRLASWNAQVRQCLSMLRLTPTRVSRVTEGTED